MESYQNFEIIPEHKAVEPTSKDISYHARFLHFTWLGETATIAAPMLKTPRSKIRACKLLD